MSNEPQVFAPDYLRAQSDKQMHLIADMIEKNVEKIHELHKDKSDLLSIVEDLLRGHGDPMRYAKACLRANDWVKPKPETHQKEQGE
jgi:hypothetical protein